MRLRRRRDDKFTDFLDALAGEVPPAILEDARYEFSHGEYDLGVENLCEHLYERGVPLSEDALKRIEQMAVLLAIPSARWEFVKQIPSP